MTTTRSAGSGSQQWFDRALLTDATRCPSCGTLLAGPRCDACGLSLAGAAGSELWDVSHHAAELLDARDALIKTMRRPAMGYPPAPLAPPLTPPVVTSHPVVTVPQVAVARTVSSAVPVSSPAPVAVPRPAPAPLPGFHPDPAWPVPVPRASWPLQNVLLGLGALLLAGASIVFLAFTWGVMPLPLRATVIALVTAAVFTAAALASRKGLASSADAIAALGSLLVLLDAWALSATGLVPEPDGATFGALAALGSAGVLVLLGILLKLDVPRGVGCVLLPVAPVLLSFDASSLAVAALLLVLAIALCGVQGVRFCEPRAAAVLRALALVLVFITLPVAVGVLLVDGPLAAASLLLAVALVSHCWSWVLAPRLPAWSIIAGSTQTLAVVCTALAVAGGVLSVASLWVAPLGALAGAGSVVLTRHLLSRLSPRPVAAGWWTFFVITAVPASAVILLLIAVVTTARPLSGQLDTMSAALVGLVVAVVGSLLDTRLRRAQTLVTPSTPTKPLSEPAPWFAALVVLGSGLLLPALPLTVAYWLTVPLVTVIAGRHLPHGWRTAARAACLAAITVAIFLSTVLSAGASSSVLRRDGGLLLAASLLTLTIVLVLARAWIVEPTAVHLKARKRADLLLAALVAGAAGSAISLGTATGEIDAAWPGASLPLLVLSLSILGLADRSGVDSTGYLTVRSRRVTAVDLHAVLVATVAVCTVTVVATASTSTGWLRSVPGIDVPPGWVMVLAVLSAALLALLVCTLALGGRYLVPESARVACAAATPPLVVLVALTARPAVSGASVVWAIIALVIVAFLPIIAATCRPEAHRVRVAMEASSVVVGAFCLLLVLVQRPAATFTVALVIAATAAAAWAFMPGRGRVGWFALGLAIGASWNTLASGGVGLVEAYSAPGAVVLAAVGAWRVHRSHPAGRYQLLAGSAVLLVPTTLLAPTGSQWRSLVVVAALVILAVGLVVARRTSADGLTTGFTVLALVVVVAGVTGRAVVLATAWSGVYGHGVGLADEVARTLLSETTALPGLWISLSGLFVGGFSWLLGGVWRWAPDAGPRSWGAGLTALVLTVPLWVLVMGGSLGDSGAAWTVLSLLVLWGATALLGTPPGFPRVRSRTEFLRRAVPPLVVAYAVAAVLGSSTAVPVDVFFTLVGGFAAVVAVRAAVIEPTVPTWSNASYGVFATLAPSTLVLMADPESWRVVLAVLAAGGWLVAGLRLRWQAPVAIGSAALVLQVVVLAGPPALAALTGVPGWVVLAVTGLVLLTLGLTYERQITTARATLRRYSELR